MPWATEQKIFIVEAYFRQKSYQRFSDEAHFLLSGHVNSKNNIFWGSTPPEHCLQRPLHSVKCTAWVAISKHGIIGPFWFEDDNERSMTINTERYVQVVGKFWTALGRRRGVIRVLQWFQQDGATPQSSNESLAWLQPVTILEWKKCGGTLWGQGKSRGGNIYVYLAWWFFIVLKIKFLWLTIKPNIGLWISLKMN